MKYIATAGAILFLFGAGAAAQNSMGQPPAQNGMQMQNGVPVPTLNGVPLRHGNKCSPDMRRLCGKIAPGNGRKLECLRAHVNELSPACRTLLPTLNSLGHN